MKSQLKQDAPLLKEAIRVGAVYIQQRGAGKFEPSDSMTIKVEAIYRLLVQDKLIIPLPQDKEDGSGMKHKLALWIEKQLPADHPLKKS
ncbi:MAG: DUF5062 family protein [Oceanospirillaceae bacterium]|nr:DUF5062 family protein [Oceanospirillaceae bacterium]